MLPALAGKLMTASLVVTAPHAMTPDGVFGSFQRYCVANQADPSSAITQADAHGWRIASDAAVAWVRVPNIERMAVRTRSAGSVTSILAAGDRAVTAGGQTYRVSFCLTAAKAGDARAVAAAVANWVGVRPVPADTRPGFVAYNYVEDESGRRSLTSLDNQSARRLLSAGVVRYLFVITSGDRVAIALSVPKL